MRATNIVIATGGTLGHIMPAVMTAKELRRRQVTVYFVGSFPRGSDVIAAEGFPVVTLSSRGLIGGLRRKVGAIFYMIVSLFQAGRALMHIRPRVVVGFGGYGAFPVVVVAWLLRIPTIIHEQNVVPGRANRLLARVVTRIAVTFEESSRYFPSVKVVHTGCPIKPAAVVLSREKMYERFGLRTERKTVFIFGGSQGSHILNWYAARACVALAAQMPIQIIHASGSADEGQLTAFYQQHAIPAFVCSFVSDVENAYRFADVVVCRSGAMTVMELASFGVPAVLIPYPHAQGHQRQNAEQLAKHGRAVIIDEKDLTADTLAVVLARMVVVPYQGKVTIPTFVRVDAAVRVADRVCEVIP